MLSHHQGHPQSKDSHILNRRYLGRIVGELNDQVVNIKDKAVDGLGHLTDGIWKLSTDPTHTSGHMGGFPHFALANLFAGYLQQQIKFAVADAVSQLTDVRDLLRCANRLVHTPELAGAFCDAGLRLEGVKVKELHLMHAKLGEVGPVGPGKNAPGGTIGDNNAGVNGIGVDNNPQVYLDDDEGKRSLLFFVKSLADEQRAEQQKAKEEEIMKILGAFRQELRTEEDDHHRRADAALGLLTPTTTAQVGLAKLVREKRIQIETLVSGQRVQLVTLIKLVKPRRPSAVMFHKPEDWEPEFHRAVKIGNFTGTVAQPAGKRMAEFSKILGRAKDRSLARIKNRLLTMQKKPAKFVCIRKSCVNHFGVDIDDERQLLVDDLKKLDGVTAAAKAIKEAQREREEKAIMALEVKKMEKVAPELKSKQGALKSLVKKVQEEKKR